MLTRPQHHSVGVDDCLSPLIFGEMVKLVKPVLSLCFLYHRGLTAVCQLLPHIHNHSLISCSVPTLYARAVAGRLSGALNDSPQHMLALAT